MKTRLTLVLFAVLAVIGRAQAPADDFASLGMKVSVTIIFDTSGSMNERNKLAMAKQAFAWWLETAPKDTIVSWSLWAFNAQNHDAINLIDRKRGAAAEVQQRINEFVANGGTPLGKTIRRVTGIIDAENRKAEEGKADILRQVVLVFTDGQDSDLTVPAVQKLVTQLRDAGCEVFSIGYQGEGDYLARVSDKFIMVGDEKQLKSGLSEFTYFIEKPAPAR
ncbi:MAG TPA: vWA domain-containing protein [Lacunisphaera sp.]|nr:vWA domain-containing protein [Lacunisphaera sp.]